jgi:hypothetical protein
MIVRKVLIVEKVIPNQYGILTTSRIDDILSTRVCVISAST